MTTRGLCIRCHEAPADDDDNLCADCAVIRYRPFCAGCGYFYAVHGVHRGDCLADQTPERQALTNVLAVFGPHLTQRSAAELHRALETSAGHDGEKGNRP
jgi:hypothetical protein